MKLTPNFMLIEFTASNTARQRGITNVPNDAELENIKFSAIQMEIVRVLCGNKPCRITSGYRTQELNRAVGGSSTSDHVTGLAVDFAISGLTGKEICNILENSNLQYDQIIDYGAARIHIGFGKRMRRKRLRL